MKEKNSDVQWQYTCKWGENGYGTIRGKTGSRRESERVLNIL
jgi:hypothetical protein